MEETTVTAIGMLIAIIIMLVVPLIMLADRSDDISQLVVQTATTEFVDTVIKTGQITSNSYQKFVSSLQSSGNTYEIDMEIQILDENSSKVVTDSNHYAIGNNSYYSIYTSQIEDKIGVSAEDDAYNSIGRLMLKQGDAISVTVKNDSATFSQALKSFYYNARGEDIHIISATASGTVAINGRVSGTIERKK